MKDHDFIGMLRKDAADYRRMADKLDEAANRLEFTTLDRKLASHTFPDKSADGGQDAPANEKLKGFVRERLEQAGVDEAWLIASGYPGGIEALSTHTGNLALDAIYAYCVEKKIPARHLSYHAERRGWKMPDISNWKPLDVRGAA